jgi:AraC-like DNA-binding protein
MKTSPTEFDLRPLNSNSASLANQDELPGQAGSYHIIWSESGQGHYQIDLEKYRIAPDVVYLIYPGQKHRIGACSFIRGYVISFTGSFIDLSDPDLRDLFLVSPYPNQAIYKSQEKPEELKMDSLISQLANACMLCTKHSDELRRALLKVMLLTLSRKARAERASASYSKDHQIVNRFLTLVSCHYLHLKKVSDYADILCIDPNYLNMKVKTASGHPASHHIKQRIINEAKRLALWEGLSLKDIAEQLNFDDLSHLSRYFKNGTGINFTNFKRSVAQTAQ